MTMPFIDLKAQFRALESDIRARMDAVLEHGQFIMGPEVRELEEKLAGFAGVKNAIACSSGTDALLLALMAHGVGPGDAVFTTPFTFIATAEVISLLGATPVYVDVDPETFNINPEALNLAVRAVKMGDAGKHPLPNGVDKLTPKGIIPVDIFGVPAEYDAIMELAESHGLFVLQDGAQSFGSEYNGVRAGALGHVSATSFFPAKPLGCYGDGGAVFTDDDEMAELMRSLMIHGMGSHRYDNDRIGINGRLDSLQAAVLLPKLAAFPGELDQRQRVADRYTGQLSKLPGFTFQKVPDGCRSAWAQYSILHERREEIQAALKEAGIPSVIYYPKPLHIQTAFAELGYAAEDMPVSMRLAESIFSLPMHPYMTDEQVDEVCGVIAGVLA
ncbi:DegT/DnrJ/EryC1/StrS family aminotransferase [Desulfovibrio ferrophilus]|uniref:DegT/DnrJ/EryC1/StrS aminotransferase n=1 Tax=Desulfovibrio ferrophilus TaxID=241368 RepID=A0A2Z6B0H1_9BACT|nr:DegT/DnrJ/EryC1/StrS family aminotransferase [Desulfovibrio ferrophilus]BBD09027.1 DegT/DnrJ/EryC1/StrS aminotransferase [Desulfovibrio ferrophilus]